MESIKKDNIPKSNKLYQICICIGAVVFVSILSIGLAAIILYKSGEVSLKVSAAMAPSAAEPDMDEMQKLYEEEDDPIKVLDWQDGWVLHDDKIYEYNQNVRNFLLMGIDRPGELGKETDLSDWKAGQADAIFLASVDMKDKKLRIIGIPRNSMVNVEVYNAEEECIDTIYNQLCLQYGYAGGGKLGLQKMKKSVSELFHDLPIHGCCAISYDALGFIADKLGGIGITVPDDMTSFNAEFTKGSVQTLDSKNVVSYLSYRDYALQENSAARFLRQKEFVATAVSMLLSEVNSNPLIIPDLYKGITPYMNTDISADQAVYIATQAAGCDISESNYYQIMGTEKPLYFTKENGETDYYDDYYLDDKQLKDVMIDVFYKEVIIDERTQN